MLSSNQIILFQLPKQVGNIEWLIIEFFNQFKKVLTFRGHGIIPVRQGRVPAKRKRTIVLLGSLSRYCFSKHYF